MKDINRNIYVAIVRKHIRNKNLVKHSLAVEAAMRGLAGYFNEDEDLWGAVGLIHDADWEETQNNIEEHTRKTAKWLKQEGENREVVINALLSHNWEHNGFRKPETKMEWALYTCDELTGLIVATTLVHPSRLLSSITVDSVMRKFKSKSFAAAVDRNQIKMCEDKLAISLPDFINIVLKAMQKDHKALGL